MDARYNQTLRVSFQSHLTSASVEKEEGKSTLGTGKKTTVSPRFRTYEGAQAGKHEYFGAITLLLTHLFVRMQPVN